MKKIIITVFTISIALIAMAETVQVGELSYNLNESEKTAEVTHSFVNNANYLGMTSIEIPSNINYNGTTYSVTSIGNWAFQECFSLTSITIPSSVTSIGLQAFLNCSSLATVIIPESMKSIGERAFEDCSSLNAINIPNNITIICI